jgi:hypothetical protein
MWYCMASCSKSFIPWFSQFSGCWLILSVYILMNFVFPVGRLLRVTTKENIKNTFTSHIDKKYLWHCCWLPYLYTISLYQNPSFTIVSAETEYISKPLNRNESGRFGAVKSDSTHHFFGNACTKSGSLRFSQFSGCWLILSVYILMNFDFPVGRLLRVR